MSSADDVPLDAAAVAALYVEFADELRRMLHGVLRDRQLVADALQAAFVKAMEQGGDVRPESRKAWLFRVAFHEALAVRRHSGVADRAREHVAWMLTSAAEGQSAADRLPIRWEQVERVRKALADLPETQRQIVHMRIYENKSFAQIAGELRIPLGTALTRMRAALGKLRLQLADER